LKLKKVNLVLSGHAYDRYLQRHIGKDLTREQLQQRINSPNSKSSAITVSGFGDNVLRIDGIHWTYEWVSELTLVLTTCLGNYDIHMYHMWEQKEAYREASRYS
jgi:hypothetical protein